MKGESQKSYLTQIKTNQLQNAGYLIETKNKQVPSHSGETSEQTSTCQQHNTSHVYNNHAQLLRQPSS